MLISHFVNSHAGELSKKIFLIEECYALSAARKTLSDNQESVRELGGALPFPNMWLEFKKESSGNTAIFVTKDNDSGILIFSAYWWGIEETNVVAIRNILVSPDSYTVNGIYRETRMNHDFSDAIVLEKSGINIKKDKLDAIDVESLRASLGLMLVQIALINSPKIIDTIIKPTQHFLNKKRIRNGKPPITEYHVIKLKPEIERQFKESEKNAASGKMPFHWRRGHFKALPCGLRWWNAHTVGKKENGEIVSGYLMESA